MSTNKKITDWFKKTPSSSSEPSSQDSPSPAVSSSRAAVSKSSAAKPASQRAAPAASSSSTSKAPTTTRAVSPPKSRARPPPKPRSSIISIADSSIDLDSSIEIVSVTRPSTSSRVPPMRSSQQQSRGGPSSSRGASSSTSKRPVPTVEITQPSSSSRLTKVASIIDLSADTPPSSTAPSPVSLNSALTLSDVDVSSDVGSAVSSSLKRPNPITPSSSFLRGKKRRTGPSPRKSSSTSSRRVSASTAPMTDDEEEEPHVEVVLTMPASSDADSIQPTAAPAPAAVADKQGQSDETNAMEWEHTPATSHPSLPDPASSSPSAVSGVSASSSPLRGDVTMSSEGEGDNAHALPPIRNLPRRARDRSVSTQPTSVSPPSAPKQPESAADVIARMRREMGLVSKNKDEASEDDEDEDGDDAAKALAAALADDSSDNDEEMQFGPVRKSASAVGKRSNASSSKPTLQTSRLFSTSSLSSAPSAKSGDDSSMDLDMDAADDSDASPGPVRRSSRTIIAPKVITPLTSASRPRKKLTEFDRLFTESKRRERVSGGADAHKIAASLLLNADEGGQSSSDEGGSDKDGSVAGTSRRSRHSRSRTGSIVPDSDDDTASEIDEDESAEERNRVDAVASKFFAGDDADKLRSVMNLVKGDKARKRHAHGHGAGGEEARWVKAGRKLWDKSIRSSEAAPTLPTVQDPLVSRLAKAIENEKFFEATLHLQCWRSSPARSDPKVVKELVSILMPFAICSTDFSLGSASTLLLQSFISSSPSTQLAEVGISLQTIIASACSALGAKADAVNGLNIAQSDPLTFGKMAQEHAPMMGNGKAWRASCAERYVRVLQTWAEKCTAPDELSDIVQFTLLIACDPTSTPEIERQVGGIIQTVFSTPMDPSTELSICRSLVRAFGNAAHAEKVFASGLIPNCSAATRRLQAWFAYGLILPADAAKWTPERYANPPPLTTIISLVLGTDTSSSSGKRRLFDLSAPLTGSEIEIDYEDITYQIQVLDVMLSDWRAFVEFQRALSASKPPAGENLSGGFSTLGLNAPKSDGPVDHLISGLRLMHDGIDDGRASNLDKTRLKAAIHRLQTRLQHEKKSAVDIANHRAGATARMNLDAHFSRRAAPVISVP